MSAPASAPPPDTQRFVRWHRRILGLCLIVFALELGAILLILPWWGNWWDLNRLPMRFPALRDIWLNPYFRGAVSGLGLLNIYVALLEILRQTALFFPRKPE